jgi:hypothetical protein
MYVRGNPLRYTDPSGHFTVDEITAHLKEKYPDHWQQYLAAWQSDKIFWAMLLKAAFGDILFAPTVLSLTNGTFTMADNGIFDFASDHALYEFQGYGPYRLITANGDDKLDFERTFRTGVISQYISHKPVWEQPLYRYAPGKAPIYSRYNRRVTYTYGDYAVDPLAGDSVPYVIGGIIFGILCPQCGIAGTAIKIASGTTAVDNALTVNHVLTVDLVDKRTFIGPRNACLMPPPDESAGLLSW